MDSLSGTPSSSTSSSNDKVWDSIDVRTVDGRRIGSNQRGILFKDAFTELNCGLKDTAEEQACLFIDLLKHELSRSLVLTELLTKIVSEKADNPIMFYFGKNSANFVDSAENWTFDVDDLFSFPVDPSPEPQGSEGGADNTVVGLIQGELLVHILEERYLMKGPGEGYDAAHFACLSSMSYQNRYRREIYEKFKKTEVGDMVWFELNEVEKEGSDVMANFWSIATDGSKCWVDNLSVSKGTEPIKYKNYTAKDAKARHEKVNFHDYTLSTVIYPTMKKVKEDILKNRKFPERPIVQMVSHILSFIEPINPEVSAQRILIPVLYSNIMLKTWGILSTKFKMAKSKESLSKLFPLCNLEKLLVDTIKEVAEKNGQGDIMKQRTNIVVVDDELKTELEAMKSSMANILADKKKLFDFQHDVQTVCDTLEKRMYSVISSL